MPRHKQPREVAELKGATRHDPQRYKLDPAKSESPLGLAPDWLSEAGKTAWFELEAVAARGVLTGADRMVMATLAELIAEFKSAPREMPAARMGHMIGLLGRMGMSPADRQKLGTEKKAEGNPFDDFN